MAESGDMPAVALAERLVRLEKRLARQTSAREQAEALLESKSLELHETNKALAGLNASLEQRVGERTRELDEERRHALFLAERDILTGLPNRLMFGKHLQRALERTGGDARVALLYLDLDGFKAVNDTLGHACGDELLKAVGKRLADIPDETVLAARLSGDEFAIIQTGGDQPRVAMALADALIQAMQAPFGIGERDIQIGTSIGIAVSNDPVETPEMLLHQADIALYRAKARQRGTWELFSPEMDIERLARLALERDLRTAIADEQFEVFYQPLHEAAGGVLVGFEALLRWNHPERGMVPPMTFIPVAEEIGLIHEIGAWVLSQACSDAIGWDAELKVAVNLSPAQFTRWSLLDDVRNALSKSGLASTRLELEITESVLMQDSESTLALLHQLRALGIHIAMDDFGTGFSSLSYLSRFPFDKIKIDRSFVQSMTEHKGSAEIIRAIIGLGRALHIKVLAEGVETTEQREMLRSEGCDELQGYLFSKPKPLVELGSLVANMRRHTALLASPQQVLQGAA
ncbi:Diguanylate cyclase [Methylorubrum aminovorans]